jgi:hypothetical protein
MAASSDDDLTAQGIGWAWSQSNELENRYSHGATAEGRQRALADNVLSKVCTACVQTVVEILEQMKGMPNERSSP